MKARIAILAALPRELAPLVQDWPVRDISHREGYMIGECDRAIAVCAGMGRDRVAYALELAAMRGPIGSVISVGYAGALHSGIEKTTVHWPATVIDALSGERYQCEGGNETLLTSNHILGRSEKLQFAKQWDADLVDMEASAVARLARTRNIPFRVLKVVSDEAEEALPDLNRFIDARGGFRETAFILHIMSHPWKIPTAVRLGRRAAQGSQAIARVLREDLENTD